MNHQEHQEELHEHHAHLNADSCCGGGCCEDEDCAAADRKMRCALIAQWVLLGGAFLFSLLTFIMLPRMVKKELVKEQALKAGGIENYEKLNKEIYDTKDYKEMMKSQVDMFIQQNKATMEMYKQQAQQGGAANPEAQPEAQPEVQPEAPATDAPATGAAQ